MTIRPIECALAAAAACALLAAQPALAQQKPAPQVPAAITVAPTGPLATVNGVQIPQQRGEQLVRQATSQGQKDGPQLRAAVRDALINREVIAQEAMKSGISKKPEFLAEVEAARQQLLLDAYLREWARAHPVTDADAQKEYDRIKAERGDKEFKVRHILVGTEDEARNVIADLKKGAKFDDLARKLSKDDGTKAKGGDLEWVSPGGSLDKDFSNAVVKLAKGRYTEAPVKTRFGFHVIQVEDVRNAQFPPLAEVKANLLNGMQQQRVAKHVEELRAKAKVE